MWKKILIINFLIILGLIFTGCVNYEVRTELGTNGSGIRTIQFGVEPKYEKIIEESAEESLYSLIEKSVPSNSQIDRFKKNNLYYYKITIPFKNIEEKGIFNFNQNGGKNKKISFNKVDRFFYVDFRFKETINLSYQLDFQDELPLSLPEPESLEINTNYWLKMPGIIIKANTEEIDGDIGIWNLKFNKKNEVEVISRVYRWSVILVTILILITIFIILGSFFIYLRSG